MAVVTKTLKSTGGDYSLMSTWESSEQTNLVTDGDSHVLECYDFALADSVGISGWTTDATHGVTIRPATGAGHTGVYGDGFSITHASNSTINNAQTYVTIEDITILSTGSNLALEISGGESGAEDWFQRLIIHASGVTGSEYAVRGVNTARDHYFINNLVISNARGIDCRSWNTSADTHYVYNNTIVAGGSYGIMVDTVDGVYSNNVAVGASIEDYYGTASGSTNASEDTSATGTSPVTGISTADGVDFTEPSTDDYTVVSAGDLDDAGTDLSGTFSDDIAGSTRTQWDIGAYGITGGGAVTVSPADISQSQTIDNVTLTQSHVLAVADIEQSQSIDNVTLTVAGSLAVQAVTQSQSIDGVTLTQDGVLSVADLSQPQVIDAATLTQHYILAVDDLLQAQSLDNVTLSLVGSTVAPDDIAQGQSIDSAGLTEHAVLAVNDLSQAQIIDIVTLGGLVIGCLEGTIVMYALMDGEVTLFTTLDGTVTTVH